MNCDTESSLNNILELFKNSTSPFIYHENVNSKSDKNNKFLNKNQIMSLYESGYFTISDLLIVKIIAKHVFATEMHIKNTINYFNRTLDGNDKVGLIDCIENVKSRLKNLCKSDIIKRYKFQFLNTDRISSYYLVSPHGYNYIKRIVNFKENYDEYLAIRPVEEVFNYLSVNNIVNAFYNCKFFKRFSNEVTYYSKAYKTKSYFYSVVESKVDNVEYRIYLEPMRFRFNNVRISKSEWKENIIERLNLIKEVVQNVDTVNYVIMVCEDVEGIQIATSFVCNYLDEIKNNVLFTTDGAAFNGGLKRTLLKMNVASDRSISLEEVDFSFID